MLRIVIKGRFKAICPICGKSSKEYTDCEEFCKKIIGEWGRGEIKDDTTELICPECERKENKC